MADFFREQPKLRTAIGVIFVLIVWSLYVIRITAGVGPMHDEHGGQAPAMHYLGGAIVVSGAVILWIGIQAIFRRTQSKRGED